MGKKKKYFLILGGIEYQVGRSPNVGDMIIFASIGRVSKVGLKGKTKVIAEGVLTDAILDVVPSRPVSEDTELEEIF